MALDIRTIEKGVCNETTRVDGFVIACRTEWLTISILECMGIHRLALQLVCVKTLHISPMILIEVGQLIVKENRRLELGGEFEKNATGRVGLARKCPLRNRKREFGVGRTEVVLIFGKGGEFRRSRAAVGVIELDHADLTASPN